MPSLPDLSDELILHIFDYIGHENGDEVRNISSTCRRLRQFFGPSIFDNIVLKNDERSGLSVQAIANGSWADCVRYLTFSGTAYIPQRDGLDLFPACVQSILSNLSQFKNLDGVTVEFKVDRLRSADPAGDQDPHTEECEALRELMELLYEALSYNSATKPITTLQLRDVIAHEVSAWMEGAFHEFLGVLDRFTLTLHGYRDTMPRVGLPYGPHMIVSGAGNYFFDHLSNVTHFHFNALEQRTDDYTNAEGYLNLTALTPLMLHRKCMPLLRFLRLGNIKITSSLTDFIRGHNLTLEKVWLDHCWIESMDVYPYSWASFFSSLLVREYPAMIDFSVTPEEVQLPSAGNHLHMTGALHDPQRVFTYATLDPQSIVRRDIGRSMAALSLGEDHEAYKQFIYRIGRHIAQASTLDWPQSL